MHLIDLGCYSIGEHPSPLASQGDQLATTSVPAPGSVTNVRATDEAFGRQQCGMGPSLVVGYRTEAATLGVFGQYYLGIGAPGMPAT